MFVTEQDAVRYLQRALESELPDERREAINHVAKTRHLTHGVVLDALSTIARTDRSPVVRCAAIVALRRTKDPRVAGTLIQVLEQPAPPAAGLTGPTPTADVRLEAMRAAVALAEEGLLSADDRPPLRDIAIRLIAQDRSRDLRQVSARLLGYCADRQVLGPLIDALSQRDFGVVYESERSLMRLTGQTFDYDPVGWRQWLEQNDDPFAEAGRLDGVLDAPPKGWLEKSIERARQTLASFGPQEG